jgi:G3E family GTPase
VQLPIPLTVLTGFLGSGKTTLLKALLQRSELAGTAVIVNELGEVGLDDALIEAAKEETVLLPSGCVCCAVRGDLVEALLELHRDMMRGELPPVRRVVLETTGLADPAPIAHTLMTERDVFRVYRLDGIVATVDGEHALGQLDAHYESAKQIAVADRIVLTKTDRAGDTARLRQRIAALNPGAEVLIAVKGAIEPGLLLDLDAHEVRDGLDVVRWLGGVAGDRQHRDHTHDHDCHDTACIHPAHGHLHGIRTFALTFERPLAVRPLELAIELLRATHGERLLRVKGILDVEGQPRPFVIHGVQHVFYPPETLERWPGEDRRSRLVMITKDLDEATVRTVFAPLLGDRAVSAAPPVTD